jgi:serine/threonine protein kinase
MKITDYNQMNDIWSLGNLIKNNPIPSLPENEFSPEFCDFMNLCLIKDLEKRPTASMLLSHPFVLMYENRPFKDLAKWLSEIN